MSVCHAKEQSDERLLHLSTLLHEIVNMSFAETRARNRTCRLCEVNRRSARLLVDRQGDALGSPETPREVVHGTPELERTMLGTTGWQGTGGS